MPTVLRSGPYRFNFYSSDEDEPVHVHVFRDDAEAKYWLNPVRLQLNDGFRPRELNRIERLVTENERALLRMWDEYFNH